MQETTDWYKVILNKWKTRLSFKWRQCSYRYYFDWCSQTLSSLKMHTCSSRSCGTYDTEHESRKPASYSKECRRHRHLLCNAKVKTTCIYIRVFGGKAKASKESCETAVLRFGFDDQILLSLSGFLCFVHSFKPCPSYIWKLLPLSYNYVKEL